MERTGNHLFTAPLMLLSIDRSHRRLGLIVLAQKQAGWLVGFLAAICGCIRLTPSYKALGFDWNLPGVAVASPRLSRSVGRVAALKRKGIT